MNKKKRESVKTQMLVGSPNYDGMSGYWTWHLVFFVTRLQESEWMSTLVSDVNTWTPLTAGEPSLSNNRDSTILWVYADFSAQYWADGLMRFLVVYIKQIIAININNFKLFYVSFKIKCTGQPQILTRER